MRRRLLAIKLRSADELWMACLPLVRVRLLLPLPGFRKVRGPARELIASFSLGSTAPVACRRSSIKRAKGAFCVLPL
jgi:hypothetical protein